MSDIEAERKIAINASVRVEPCIDGRWEAVCDAVYGPRRVEIRRCTGLTPEAARLALVALLA